MERKRIKIYCINDYIVNIESIDDYYVKDNTLYIKPTYESGLRFYPINNVIEYHIELYTDDPPSYKGKRLNTNGEILKAINTLCNYYNLDNFSVERIIKALFVELPIGIMGLTMIEENIWREIKPCINTHRFKLC